ncbi:MAG: copper homeostasis protein CutC [Bacteroidaceae bacterium]
MIKLEICANSVESAWAAYKGGAQRIELCTNLEEGGTTPTWGMMKQVAEIPSITKHILIRPRTGDFCYNTYEVNTMIENIKVAKSLGMNGIVIGCLLPNGSLDIITLNRLIMAASGMNITFHRAFDCCINPLKTLQQIIDLGCNYLLTSGQAETAELGIDMLKTLREQAKNDLIILPGKGINENNILKIKKETGLKEFHSSASQLIDNQNKTIEEKVRKMRNLICPAINISTRKA